MWVATSAGTANTLAYSSDGIHWTGLGKTIFSGGNITFFINAGAGGNPNGANGVNMGISWGVLGLSAPAPAPP